MIARLIRSKGAVAIVELPDGSDCRALPASVVARRDGDEVEVADAEWAKGAEYGIRWDDLTIDQLCVPVAKLREQLQKRGLRSAADILAQQRLAREAMYEALGDLLSVLVSLDKEEVRT